MPALMSEPREDRQAAYYRTRFQPLPARDKAWQAICRYLERHMPADPVVLELGAGYCSFSNHVSARERHALDSFAGFVEYAAPEVTTHVGTCTDLTRFADARFSVVFASNLLEHLTREELDQTMHEVRRVLQPGGRMLLIQPNFRYCFREYFDDYTHRSVFSHVSLADFVQASGFRIDDVQPRFLPLTFKSRLPAWPWLVRLYLQLPVRPLGKQMLLVATRA